MNLQLVSYNAHNINDTTNFVAKFANTNPLQDSANTIFARRAGASAAYAGKEFLETRLEINLTCRGTYLDQFETVNQWFNTNDETPYILIAQDTDDSNKQYQVNAVVKSISPPNGRTVKILLAKTTPIWKTVTQNDTNWAITASGQTQAVTAGGNIESHPLFEFTPTASGGAYAYKNYISVYPAALYGHAGAWVDITNGGWDHAALVTGGKSLASGNDVRVMVDGVEVDRWAGTGANGWNLTVTKLFIVLDMPQSNTLTLATAIANSGTPSTVDASNTTANQAAFSRMPDAGRFIIDSEEFTYTSKSFTGNLYRFAGIARTLRNTSIAAHSVGATIRHIPYDITVLYGNASASAPVIDDTKKPVIDLTSTNASAVYTSFYDAAGKRAGAWKPQLVSTNSPTRTNSNTYTGTNDGAAVDPAEVMGAEIASYQAAGAWQAETAELTHALYVPEGVTNTTVTGAKYRNTASWPVATLQDSLDGNAWNTIWTEVTPASLSTWTALTSHSAVAGTSGARYLRFRFKGNVIAGSGNTAEFEQTAVTITITNPPVVAMRGEQANIQFAARMTNTTSGEYFDLNYPLGTNQTLYVECDPDGPPSVKFDGQYVNGAIALSTKRGSKWLALQPGSNTLTYTMTGTGNVTVHVKWYDRMNFL